MVSFILGRSGSGKTHEVLEQMQAAAQSGQKNLILLVPEQQSHLMDRKLCEKISNSASLHAETATFKRLCRRVAAEAGGLAQKQLDDGARVIHMYCALKKTTDCLGSLKSAAARPEFLDTLLSIADKIKAAGMMPEELDALCAEFPESLGKKVKDISAILAAYQAELGQGKNDPMGELQKLEQDIKNTGFFKGKRVWIDGFTGFTGIEYKILRHIFSQCEDVAISLCADPSDTAPALKKCNDTFISLKAMAPQDAKVITLEGNKRARNQSIAHVERYALSDKDLKPFNGKCDITLAVNNDIRCECEFAASEILKLVREEGYRFRDISVSVRDIEEYADVIDSVFSYYDLPFYLSRKAPVLEKAPVALSLSALKCIGGNFAYDDMLRYLKTGISGINSLASDMLEEYMSVWHLRGSDWSREGGFNKHPDGYGEKETENSLRTLRVLNRIREKLMAPLLSLRSAIKADGTGQGYVCAIFEYFNQINLPQRLESRAKALRMQGNLQTAEEYSSLWNVLCNALDSIGIVLGDTHFEIEEFTHLFKLVLSKYSVGTIPIALDRVSVGDLSGTGLAGKMRCQIILGANEGTIPKISTSSTLFSEKEYALLSDAGVELVPDPTAMVEEEFRLAYTALSAPSEKLIVSRPLLRSSGDVGNESFICTRLKNLFPGICQTHCDKRKVRAAAPAPCFDCAAQGGEEWSGAREWFSENSKWKNKLKLVERGSRVERGPIKERENISAIFGKEIYVSASRADVYASCRYKYFLEYGLRLRKKEPARLDAPIAGTLIHYIMEKTLLKIKELGGTRAVSYDKAEEIARESAEEFRTEQLGGEQSPRFSFIFNRLVEITVQVAKDVCLELNNSDFVPLDFELKVGDNGGKLPSIRLKGENSTLRLEGYIDRVDGMELPDGRLCVRIVDYKSGKKDFDLDEVLNGLNIQLLVYLFALEKGGRALYGREIVPGGVMYVPARAPEFASSGNETAQELEEMRLKQIRRKGIVIKDEKIINAMEHGATEKTRFIPVNYKKDGSFAANSGVISAENLSKLRAHLDSTLTDMANTLSKGDVCANPYYKNRSENACTYCQYSSACMFDGAFGDKHRYLFKTDPKDFFKSDKKEGEQDAGSKVD